MSTSQVSEEASRRRTFAIISHPDAGKTTLTEKLLLFAGAIQIAGSVKARKASAPRHLRLDGDREAARHLGGELGDADGVPRLRDQPARHARPPGLLRGHLPRADRGRRGADGDRRGQRRGGADAAAARSLPRAQHADHHLHQQAGPRGARAARAARRDRARAGHADACRSPGRSAWASASAASSTCRGDRMRVFRAGRGPAGRTHDEVHRGHRQPASARALRRRVRAGARRDRAGARAPRRRSTARRSSRGEQTPVFFGSAINNFGVREVLDALVDLAPPPGPQARAAARGASPTEDEVHRRRLQDPGQHGPGAPRPRRVRARVLGPLRARHEAEASRAPARS